MKSSSSSFSPVASLLLLFAILLPSSIDAYVNWAAIPEGSFVGPGVNQILENDFCDVVRDDSIALLDALKGRNLSIAVQYGPGFDFFQFHPDQKLSITNPGGMIPIMLDELARRGDFQWRDSFVAYNSSTLDALGFDGTKKWDSMLNWTIANFDLAVDKWLLTTGRLQNESVFLHSWFDASLILVDQGNNADLNWLAFAAPFDGYVWIAIICTVFLSAVFMMIIEAFEGRRDGRSIKKWFGEQLYFSSLAISQHFHFYNPKTGAGRVFLSSFAFWSMLVGATYTANLASLLVEDALASPVQTIEQAMDQELSICIHAGSASEAIIESLYSRTKSYEKFFRALTPESMYEALKDKECDILLGTRQEYDIFGNQQKYGCNLVQAGRELHSSTASFVIDFDPLNCDSVLGAVLNIHLNAMSVDGNMTKYWANYLDGIEGTCTDESGRRRMVETDGEEALSFESTATPSKSSLQPHNNRRRKLAINAIAAAASSVESGEEALSISSMAGLFILHAMGAGLSIICVMYSVLAKRRKQNALALRKQSHHNTSAESEMHRKYEAMKEDMAQQMLTMQMEMMTQIYHFFQMHSKFDDMSHSARSDHIAEQQERHYNERSQETIAVVNITKTAHKSDRSLQTGFMSRALSAGSIYDRSEDNLQDL